ncbi:MAG: hypothetical protein ACE5FZ_07165 [Nitrospiria bacterium]
MTVTTDAPPLGATVNGRFFNSLGPGAITDNMFGVISSVHRGADNLPDTSDDEPGKCGQNVAAGIPPDQADTSGSSLNCGDLRFDPASQGMTVPGFPASDKLDSIVFSPATFLGDSATANLNFGTNSDLHASIDLKNRFIWNNTSASITDVDLVVPCTAGTVACVGGAQKEKEVIAVSGTTFGTLASPGAGEQVFDQTSDWNISGSTGNTFAAPLVNWTQSIQNPVFGDLLWNAGLGDNQMIDNNSNRRFDTGSMTGSFTRESGTATNITSFPPVNMPFVSATSTLDSAFITLP